MLTPGCQSNANHSSGHLKPTLQQRHWACMVSFCHKSNPKEPSCHTLRCWNFKVETVIITTKDPNALLRINDAGVTIAHGGGIAGSDFVPWPGGRLCCSKRAASTHKTCHCLGNQRYYVFCVFWNDLSFFNTYVFWLSSSLSRQETPNTM